MKNSEKHIIDLILGIAILLLSLSQSFAQKIIVNGPEWLEPYGYVNGTNSQYQFFVSDDTLNWGEPISSGNFLGGSSEKHILFNDAVDCKYIRLVSLSEINDNPFACIADLTMLGKYSGVSGNACMDKLEDTIALYPNPSNGESLYLLNRKDYGDELEVTLFNMQGNSILNIKLATGQDIIRLGNSLSPGTCWIII